MVITSKTINYTVETVEELSTIVGQENDVIVVTDENRGGTFVYRSAEAGINNDGTVFDGWVRQYSGAVNIKWFGAVGDGITDDTAAFNLATQAFDSYHEDGSTVFSNNSWVKKDILVPSTTTSYVIGGTVYIRKGQHLRGDGLGPSRIYIPVEEGVVMPGETTAPTFKLGVGIVNGVYVSDEGGLPASISNLATEGGHTNGAVIDANGIAGATIDHLFITTAPIGIEGMGGDLSITNCTIDNGGIGIKTKGSRNIIANNNFFWNDIGIKIEDDTYDLVIANNIFSYANINDIEFTGTAGLVKDILISDCKFLMNGQTTTNAGAIRISTGNPSLTIKDCKFTNLYTWAVVQASAENIDCIVDGCVFDGKKSHSTYTQSSTMQGVRVGNGDWIIQNSVFKNLFGKLIQISQVGGNTGAPLISNNSIYSNTSTNSFVHFNSLSDLTKTIRINNNNRLSGTNLLINSDYIYTATTYISITKNNGFFTLVTASGRKYIILQTVNSLSCMLSVTYNGAIAGSAVYRRTGIFTIDKGVMYNGAVVDYVIGTQINTSSAGSIPPAIDVQFELDAVGSGSVLPYTSANRYREVVVSVPETNTGYINFELI